MKHMIGNLLKNVKSGVIVHGCNAQGVMGSGIAAQVKEMYPEAYRQYKMYLQNEFIFPCAAVGKVLYVKISDELTIANAITQCYFGAGQRQVDYEAVAKCFEDIAGKFPDEKIHYPMIGAGLGGGNWDIISTIIDETLSGLNHTVWTLK